MPVNVEFTLTLEEIFPEGITVIVGVPILITIVAVFEVPPGFVTL